MAQKRNIDELIRDALKAEGIENLDLPGEPGLPDMVTEVFRGRMWWIGAFMTANILACTVLAVVCGVQFFRAGEVPDIIRWGTGFLFCVIVVVGCKLGYWMQVSRVSAAREIKRLELLIAHLAGEPRSRA